MELHPVPEIKPELIPAQALSHFVRHPSKTEFFFLHFLRSAVGGEVVHVKDLRLARQVDANLVVSIPFNDRKLAAIRGRLLLSRAKEGSPEPDRECCDPDSEQCCFSHRTDLYISVDNMAHCASGTSEGANILPVTAAPVNSPFRLFAGRPSHNPFPPLRPWQLAA